MNLNPQMTYLVVELFSAEGLPIADSDNGLTNAVMMLKYDGLTLITPIVHQSLRPIWNSYFHFPVVFHNNKVKTDPNLVKKVLPADMRARGNLIFEL